MLGRRKAISETLMKEDSWNMLMIQYCISKYLMMIVAWDYLIHITANCDEFAGQRKQSKRRMRCRSEVVHFKSIMKMKTLPALFTASLANKLLWCKTLSNWNLLIQQVPYINDQNSFQALQAKESSKVCQVNVWVKNHPSKHRCCHCRKGQKERDLCTKHVWQAAFPGADLGCVLPVLVCIFLSFSILIP